MNRLIVDLNASPEIPKFNNEEFESMYCDLATSKRILTPEGSMFFKMLTPQQKRKTFIIVRGYETYQYLFQLHKQGVIHIGLRNFNWNTIQALDVCWIEGVRFAFFGHLPSKPFGEVYSRWQKVMSPDVEKEPIAQPKLSYINTIEGVKQAFHYFKEEYKGLHATDFETYDFPEYEHFENLCVSLSNMAFACTLDIRELCGYDYYYTNGEPVEDSSLVWEDGKLKTIDVPTKEEVMAKRNEFNQLYKQFLIDTEDRYMCFNAEFEPRCCYRQTGYFPRFIDIWAYSKAMDNISNNLKWFTQYLCYEPSWDDESEETQHLLERIFKTWRQWEDFLADTESVSKKFRTRQEVVDFYIKDAHTKNPSVTDEVARNYAEGFANQWINIYDPRIKLTKKYWGNTWASVQMKTMGKYNCLDSFYTMADYEEIQKRYKGQLDKSARILSNQKLNAALIRMNGIFIQEGERQKIEVQASDLENACFMACTAGYIRLWREMNKNRQKDFGLSKMFCEFKKFPWFNAILIKLHLDSDEIFEDNNSKWAIARQIIGCLNNNYKSKYFDPTIRAIPKDSPSINKWLEELSLVHEDFKTQVGMFPSLEYDFLKKILDILIPLPQIKWGQVETLDALSNIVMQRFLPEIKQLKSMYPPVQDFREDIAYCLQKVAHLFYYADDTNYCFDEYFEVLQEAPFETTHAYCEVDIFGLKKIDPNWYLSAMDATENINENYWALDNPYMYCLGNLYTHVPEFCKKYFTYGEWLLSKQYDDFIDNRINPIKDLCVTEFNQKYYNLIGANSLQDVTEVASLMGNWKSPSTKASFGLWLLVNLYIYILTIKYEVDIDGLDVDDMIAIMEENYSDPDHFWEEYEPATREFFYFPLLGSMDEITNLFKNGLGLDGLGLHDLKIGTPLECPLTDIAYHMGFGYGFGCVMQKEKSTYINGITTKSSKLIASMDDMGCTTWVGGSGGEDRYDEDNWY